MVEEKDNGIWTNRVAVQKAFDADPQAAYNAVAAVLTTEQAAQVENTLLPPLTDEEWAAKLALAASILETSGRDDAGDLLNLDRKSTRLNSSH